MVRIRPTLLRKVRALLDAPAESADQLARDVITLIEEDRAERREYVVVVNDSGLLSAYGTYATVKECQRAVGNPIAASKPGAKGYLMILHRDMQTEADDE